MRVTAAVTAAKGAPFELAELDLDEAIRADEVLVDIAACGICHTDLICRDQWLPVPLPAVLGHEGAGTVRAVGARVSKVRPGQRVGLTFDSCGSCACCRRGKPTYCHRFFRHNFAAARAADGTSALSRRGEVVHAHFFGQSSFASAAVARERNVVAIESDIPLAFAAPLGCGIQTGAGAVLNTLRVGAGARIAVFGTGAVGISAIMAAAIAGAERIIGVDRVPARLELARELGATDVIDSTAGDAVAAIRRIGGDGVDFSLDTTGSPALLRSAVDCLAPLGVAGLIGGSPTGTEVSLDMTELLVGGRTLRGVVEGDSVPELFIPALIRLWERGRFPVERLIRSYDFDAIEQAARDAQEGRTIKPVLLMSS
jgi:aryl-alcohol dehydrogenase